MVERGLNANHLMTADYTLDLKVDGKSMKDIVFSRNEQINFLHSQIHDLQSQVFEYEARFKGRYIIMPSDIYVYWGLAQPQVQVPEPPVEYRTPVYQWEPEELTQQ
ncbi:40S ribosomal protein S5-1 [Hordeum vulgare]|nr:40S ribosomal protein S5-1 [Hordeum vulgare]